MDKNRKENTETRTKEEKERAFVFLYVCDCVCVCDIFWEKKIAKKKKNIYWERDIYRERLKTLGKSLRWLSKKQTQKGVNGVLALYWG